MQRWDKGRKNNKGRSGGHAIRTKRDICEALLCLVFVLILFGFIRVGIKAAFWIVACASLETKPTDYSYIHWLTLMNSNYWHHVKINCSSSLQNPLRMGRKTARDFTISL